MVRNCNTTRCLARVVGVVYVERPDRTITLAHVAIAYSKRKLLPLIFSETVLKLLNCSIASVQVERKIVAILEII